MLKARIEHIHIHKLRLILKQQQRDKAKLDGEIPKKTWASAFSHYTQRHWCCRVTASVTAYINAVSFRANSPV